MVYKDTIKKRYRENKIFWEKTKNIAFKRCGTACLFILCSFPSPCLSLLQNGNKRMIFYFYSTLLNSKEMNHNESNSSINNFHNLSNFTYYLWNKILKIEIVRQKVKILKILLVWLLAIFILFKISYRAKLNHQWYFCTHILSILTNVFI